MTYSMIQLPHGHNASARSLTLSCHLANEMLGTIVKHMVQIEVQVLLLSCHLSNEMLETMVKLMVQVKVQMLETMVKLKVQINFQVQSLSCHLARSRSWLKLILILKVISKTEKKQQL